MIHCVLHDPQDSVAVVVVEGVKAGMTLTGLILDEDRTLSLPCTQDIPLGHKVALRDLAPGDTVTFVAADKGHNAEVISSMMPAGAAPFKGKMSQTFTVKFSKPGVYGYKCLPHYGLGMVGAVIVGSSQANAAQAKAVSHPGKAKQKFASILK